MINPYYLRNKADHEALVFGGVKWVTAVPRGDNIGLVLSKHKSYENASRAARGKDRVIVQIVPHDNMPI